MLARLNGAPRALLAYGVAAAALMSAPSAWAQAAAGAVDSLEEVVVTATRQTDTVNRVPLSITAVTQRSLDQQGVKSVQDLARTVPGLIVGQATAGVANFSIRGIVAAQGAATTGVYIDDTAIHKRATLGAALTQNAGTPTPPLFDLERVEVLRGPQGTLYGGSSQGGAIRYITPSASLTRYSAYGRAELSTTKHGGESYEAGAAVGGPIIADKLGFRASIFGRKTGGWVDLVDPYRNGALRYTDSNDGESRSARVAVTWAPTERARATLSYFGSKQEAGLLNGSGVFRGPVNQTFTTQELCYNNSSTPVSCAGPITYRRPSATFGPFPYLNEYVSVQREEQRQTTVMNVYNLTLDYDFDTMSFRSITSGVHDQSKSLTYDSSIATGTVGITLYPTTTRLNFLPLLPDAAGGQLSTFFGRNNRNVLSQEFRFSSRPNTGPLSWVAGVFYSRSRGSVVRELHQPLDVFTNALFGLPAVRVYSGLDANGVRVPLPPLADGISYRVYQAVGDSEFAGFGEANYQITDALRITGGLRIARIGNEYSTFGFGPVNGYNVPSVVNGGLLPTVSVTESPISPKVAAQYELSSNDMVYVSVSKGFRAGGANILIPEAVCGPGLATFGMTVRDVPPGYDSDTVWSYEAGGKFRLGDRVQINSSAFRIDWKNVQLPVSLPGCSQTFITNAGSARSQGFDVQAQVRFFGLTASATVAYTHGEYITNAVGPRPSNTAFAPTLVVQAGDKLPVPPWTVSLGAQYDFQISSRVGAYIRGDYQFASKYLRGFGPGVSTYSPDTRFAEATQYVSARAGVTMGAWEVNAFVNNLFDSTDALDIQGGRAVCRPVTDAACSSFAGYNPLISVTTFRPREIGLQASFRY
jgi:outer membrane receptor protein involved in Fe transport